MLLFGIPVGGPGASDVQVEHGAGCASLTVDGNLSLAINHQLIPDQQFGLERFSVFPCYTGFTSASQIAELRIGVERNTFGYIFPITSFTNEIGFDDRFGLIYADAAFRKFVTIDHLVRFQSGYSIERTEVGHVPLDAVVNDTLSLLAVSNEVLAKHEVSPEVLELMLRRRHIEVSTINKCGPAFSPAVEFSPGINFNKPKVEDGDDIAKLCLLLQTADDDNSKIGQFIQYYQFFEYMILKIFEWGIPYVSRSGLSPWDVRDRLNDLGAESRRLYRLDAHCIPGLSDRESQAELIEACSNFLGIVGVDKGQKKSWYSLLYLVRNSVVHNQFKLLNHEYLAALAAVNVSLRAVALDCFFNFEDPGPGGFFD